MRGALIKTGRLRETTPVFLTHLSRILHESQAVLERQLERPLIPCFDGMRIEI